MHKEAKGHIPTLQSRDITLVTKYANEVKELLKCIQKRIVSEPKCIFDLQNGWRQNISHHKQKETILKVENRKGHCNLEKGFK